MANPSSPKSGYTIELMNDDLLAFLDTHKIDRAILDRPFARRRGTDPLRPPPSRPRRRARLSRCRLRPLDPEAGDRAGSGARGSRRPTPIASRSTAYIAFTKRTRTDINRFWSPVLDREMAASIGQRSRRHDRLEDGADLRRILGQRDLRAARLFRDHAPRRSLSMRSRTKNYLPARQCHPRAKGRPRRLYVRARSTSGIETSIAQFRVRPGHARSRQSWTPATITSSSDPAETLRLIEDFLARNGL